MLRFDGEYPDHEQAAVKCSIEKPISLDFVNLSTIFCPRSFINMHAQTFGSSLYPLSLPLTNVSH